MIEMTSVEKIALRNHHLGAIVFIVPNPRQIDRVKEDSFAFLLESPVIIDGSVYQVLDVQTHKTVGCAKGTLIEISAVPVATNSVVSIPAAPATSVSPDTPPTE